MEVSGAALAGVSVFVVLAGMVGVVGLVLAGYTDVSGGRGRMLLLCGLGAAGVGVGLVGTMISGDTVRVGGLGPSLKDAGDFLSRGGVGGVSPPPGAPRPLWGVVGVVGGGPGGGGGGRPGGGG